MMSDQSTQNEMENEVIRFASAIIELCETSETRTH